MCRDGCDWSARLWSKVHPIIFHFLPPLPKRFLWAPYQMHLRNKPKGFRKRFIWRGPVVILPLRSLFYNELDFFFCCSSSPPGIRLGFLLFARWRVSKTVTCRCNSSFCSPELRSHLTQRPPPPAPYCVQVLNIKVDPLWKEPHPPNLPRVTNETYRQRLITLNCPFPFTCLTQITHWVNRFFSPSPPLPLFTTSFWRTSFEGHERKARVKRDLQSASLLSLLWETFRHHCQAGGEKRGRNDCKGRDAFHTHFRLNAKMYIFSKRPMYNFAFRPFRHVYLNVFFGKIPFVQNAVGLQDQQIHMGKKK